MYFLNLYQKGIGFAAFLSLRKDLFIFFEPRVIKKFTIRQGSDAFNNFFFPYELSRDHTADISKIMFQREQLLRFCYLAKAWSFFKTRALKNILSVFE